MREQDDTHIEVELDEDLKEVGPGDVAQYINIAPEGEELCLVEAFPCPHCGSEDGAMKVLGPWMVPGKLCGDCGGVSGPVDWFPQYNDWHLYPYSGNWLLAVLSMIYPRKRNEPE